MINESSLLESLNSQQKEAVSAPPKNLLILAGAGSGKTRVLVHRVAWLIHQLKYAPHSIMAVTFTNKAAGELKGRIETLLHNTISHMWVGTFHSLSHRFLRTHWSEANLSKQFQILDSEDQQRMIRRVIKSLNLDENQWSPREAQWFINEKKDQGLRPFQLGQPLDYYSKTMHRIYEVYENICQQSSLVDFSELLLRTHELFKKDNMLLNHYRNRFRYILVDEFQDTNRVQYEWLKQLSFESNNIMIVGDDDQSIYGWRGARIENIRRFTQDFSDTTTIRLEQNYRSTGTILKAANALISHNEGRMGKKLWCEGEEGTPIALYAAFNEIDEAKFVVERILEWIYQGNSRSDIAVLYRSNAQSRVIEEGLIQAGIPYRVYGGLRFFERAEIKDALSYLRLLANLQDDAAFERIVNQPNRGIGERTMSHLRETATKLGVSLWQASLVVVKENQLTSRAHEGLASFIKLIEELKSAASSLELSELTQEALYKSGLMNHYSKQKGEKAQSRVENLEELINATKNFSPDPNIEESILDAFLSNAALEAGEAQGDPHQECVQLMTLHSAKGLEFPLVFMVGVEEGVFPHQLSIEDPERLEEERRLCYVGMTRAKKHLYITYAELRRQFGKEVYHTASRFIREMDSDCLVEIRKKMKVRQPLISQSQKTEINKNGDFNVGQRVLHKQFGEGVLINMEGRGEHTRVEVQFKREGRKWLVLAYARLQPVIET